MRKRAVAGILAGVGLGGLYLFNASWLAASPTGRPKIVAHRGVHQTFDRTNLKLSDCTATRMRPPTNPYLENTIGSMRASFELGADQIELDVHPTTDREFAVFHDWAVDCRTNGKGVTREQSMAYLRTLDLGYGYTADGGETYPFRGKFVGEMKTLHEVLTTFPGKRFLINIKSNDPAEVDQLVRYLKEKGDFPDKRLGAVGSDTVLDRVRAIAPKMEVLSVAGMKACSLRYIAVGWSGYIPEVCRHAKVGVPANLRWAFWGWPNRFLQRMRDADVEVMMAGPLGSKSGDPGFTDPTQLRAVPTGFNGSLLTDDVEKIGPAAMQRWPR
jgi:glycerophosphoryl diester phosphodiesterase